MYWLYLLACARDDWKSQYIIFSGTVSDRGFELRAELLLLAQKPVLCRWWSGVVETHAPHY